VTGVEWPALIGALREVERLGQADSGVLSFGEAPVGGIFVEQGRVCWVAARGLQRRLRDLLRAHSRMSTEQLEGMYERCRVEGRLLGETLVDEGIIAPGELQRALRRHSAECLLDLCRSPRATAWSSHGGRGYAPRFTFRPVDLLFDSVAIVYPELQAQARQELSDFEAKGRRAVAFVRDESADSLLPLAETGGYGVEPMLGLSRGLASLPHACLELGATPSFTLSTTEEGETVLLWWRGPLLFAVSCPDRQSLAELTAHHLALQ
jgi:hypothetical protein